MSLRLPVIADPGSEPRSPPELPGVFPQRMFIDTYGCQMNEHDSARMVALMAAEGYAPTDTPDDADLIIINSCSVRDKAEQKLRSAAGKLKRHKRRRPEVVVALAGCVAQQEGERLLDRNPHADLVFGPDHIERLPEMVRRVQEERVRLVETRFFDRSEYSFPALPEAATAPVSAYVSVMKGCDKFCSFCIVPMTRGREVCRSAEEIVDEVRRFASRGTKEVILLGQTVNSYGRIKRFGHVPFHELLARVSEVDGIERIRFTSPHPADFCDEQIEAFRTLPKLCPHMHLPVQSGSNRILEAMRRGYSREGYLEIVEKFRRAVPHAALTTDLIVGFPGEEQRDFEDTLALLEEVRFDGAFSFAYSERKGTKALELGARVPPEERLARLRTLQDLQDRITGDRLKRAVGTEVEVLVEGPSKTDPTRLSGRTATNRPVHLLGAAPVGQLVKVRVVEAFKHSLLGEVVEG